MLARRACEQARPCRQRLQSTAAPPLAPRAQAITGAFWLRVSRGAAAPLMHLFLGVETLLYAIALAWRWRSRTSGDQGSYSRWRELLSVAQRGNEAVLGCAAGWTVAWMSQVKAAEDGPGAPWAAARHATLLLLASAAPAHLLTWAKPVRLW